MPPLVERLTNPANTLAAVKITTLPAIGTIKVNNEAVAPGQVIAIANIPNLVYIPGLNANGNSLTSFTFQVQDNGGTANGGVDLAIPLRLN